MCRFIGQAGPTPSTEGSFAGGKPINGYGEWIVFDLQQPLQIAKMRLVNYWSSNDSWSFRNLIIETATALGGPFIPLHMFSNLPRCSVSKAVDLYVNGNARFWRIRCTASYGGGAFGIYGIDFWISANTEACRL